MLVLVFSTISGLFLLGNVVIKKDLEEWQETLRKVWKVVKPYLTWRVLLTYGVLWMITVGWSFITFIVCDGWIKYVSGIWLGITQTTEIPEIFIIPLAIALQKKLFKKEKRA